jgi:hypothetical protein
MVGRSASALIKRAQMLAAKVACLHAVSEPSWERSRGQIDNVPSRLENESTARNAGLARDMVSRGRGVAYAQTVVQVTARKELTPAEVGERMAGGWGCAAQRLRSSRWPQLECKYLQTNPSEDAMVTKRADRKTPDGHTHRIGGELLGKGMERRQKLQTMINSRPRHARNDLLPTMELQTLAITDLKMPEHMVPKLDPGHIEEVANIIQPMGFSGDQGRARRPLDLTANASSPPTRAPPHPPQTPVQPYPRLANTHLMRRAGQSIRPPNEYGGPAQRQRIAGSSAWQRRNWSGSGLRPTSEGRRRYFFHLQLGARSVPQCSPSDPTNIRQEGLNVADNS